MAARAIWKGVIRVGTLRVPIRLYSAVEDRDVHFRLLHEKDQTPVRQEMVNPRSGKPVPSDEIRKGYEVARGTFVILTDEELDALEPDDSRDVRVTRFVGADAIGHEWFERPYYVGPDAKGSADYFALAQALADAGKEGIARWVMRDREYAGALRARGPHLVLVTLRHADEVVARADLRPPPFRKPTEKELRLAEQLVGALQADFDPGRYRDEYRKRVLDFVQAKAKGRRPRLPRPPRRTKPSSLLGALEASVRGVRKERKRA
jgi:DNA end-binding protein Ku